MRSLRCVIVAVLLGLIVPGGLFAQWEPDVRLTNDPFDSITCFANAKAVATSGDTVHVVWADSRDGNFEIYYKQSLDGGTTWGVDTALTADASWSERPTVVADGSTVHVAWYDGRLGPPRIFYKKSLDNGATWGADVSLTPAAGVAYHPSMVVSGSTVHVAWTDMSAGPQIYYTRSLDSGTTWETQQNITPSAPAAGKNFASIAASGSDVHVAWMDYRGEPRIYYTRSQDNGVTWDTDKAITSTYSQFPSIVAVGSTIHMVYSDFRDGEPYPRTYYQRSPDAGDSWDAEVALTISPAAWYPSIAACGSFVQTVWLTDLTGDPEVYSNSSDDGGITWQGLPTRLTDNPSDAKEPSVAISDSGVHVVWHDDRDANWETYYKRMSFTTATLSATISADPSSGTLPFSTQFTVQLNNDYDGQTRTMAAHIDAALASGATFPNWRAGFTNVAASDSYHGSWYQNIPALATLVGANVFTLVAEDVTPAPYNQPPYPPAGDTATSFCTVTGIAP